jgi:hypothetical protein
MILKKKLLPAFSDFDQRMIVVSAQIFFIVMSLVEYCTQEVNMTAAGNDVDLDFATEGKLPRFGCLDELRPSRFFAYLKSHYDAEPDEEWFPIDLSTFAVLDKKALYEAGLTSYPVKEHNCPDQVGQMTNQFVNDDYNDYSYVYIRQSPPFEAAQDNAWVEVIHHKETHESWASWNYIMKGSGVWVNVGKTVVYQQHVDCALDILGVNVDPDYDTFEEICAAAREKQYDSIQFLSHADQECGNGAAELVLLHGTGTYACQGLGEDDIRVGWTHDRPCKCNDDEPTLNCSPRLRVYGQAPTSVPVDDRRCSSVGALAMFLVVLMVVLALVGNSIVAK